MRTNSHRKGQRMEEKEQWMEVIALDQIRGAIWLLQNENDVEASNVAMG